MKQLILTFISIFLVFDSALFAAGPINVRPNTQQDIERLIVSANILRGVLREKQKPPEEGSAFNLQTPIAGDIERFKSVSAKILANHFYKVIGELEFEKKALASYEEKELNDAMFIYTGIPFAVLACATGKPLFYLPTLFTGCMALAGECVGGRAYWKHDLGGKLTDWYYGSYALDEVALARASLSEQYLQFAQLIDLSLARLGSDLATAEAHNFFQHVKDDQQLLEGQRQESRSRWVQAITKPWRACQGKEKQD